MTQNPDANASLDYLAYWRVAQPVFRRGHGDSDLFFPPSYQAELQRLRYYLRKGATGVIAVSMPAGHGKSTLARQCYQGLGMDEHEAILVALYQSQDKSGWLLPKLARFLGVAADVEALGHALDELAEEKRRLTILVDEADKLTTAEAFTEIHALLSLPNVRAVELNVVMFGITGWDHGALRQSKLAPHVRLASHFPAYGWAETTALFAHCLAKSGLDAAVFPLEHLERAHAASRGILARLTHILENCLMESCLAGKAQVDRQVVQSVLESVGRGDYDEAPAAAAPASRTDKKTMRSPPAAPAAVSTDGVSPSGNQAPPSPEPENSQGGLRSLFLKDRNKDNAS